MNGRTNLKDTILKKRLLGCKSNPYGTKCGMCIYIKKIQIQIRINSPGPCLRRQSMMYVIEMVMLNKRKIFNFGLAQYICQTYN